VSQVVPEPERQDESSRLRVRLEEAQFALELSRRTVASLEAEIRLLEHRLAQAEADRAAVKNRLDERESYVAAVHRSGGWKILQRFRGFFGRRW
jgi:predicted nuclease with TOPRIM domain